MKTTKIENYQHEFTFYFQQLVGAEYALQQNQLQVQSDYSEEDYLSS